MEEHENPASLKVDIICPNLTDYGNLDIILRAKFWIFKLLLTIQTEFI